MSVSDVAEDLLPGAPLSRAAQLVRRLAWLYGAFAAVMLLALVAAVSPFGGSSRPKELAAEFLAGGLAAPALDAVFLALTALLAAALLTESRLWLRRAEAARLAGELGPQPPVILAPLWRLGPGVLARQGQAAAVCLGALIIGLTAWLLWPQPGAAAPTPGAANLVAAVVIGLAFPSLIAERMMSAFPAAQMPEAPGLRRILLLITLGLAIAGAAEIGRGLGFGWVAWIWRALTAAALLIAVEIALRALARLFLPAPAPETARAATESLIVGLVTGVARSPGTLIRVHLGLDFTRSWALSYLTAAAIPAVVATALFCWALSGVKLLNGDQRGVYERLGAPVGVLGPGLHILLPWPLGRLRPVEYGTIHTIAVSTDAAPESIEQIGADDTPPASMNRLWDTGRPTEAEYLVASQTEGQQGFQVVNAEIRVLYRTGLTNAAAWQSVYGSSDQQAVVKEEASRLATRYFSSHTLDEVMGGQRESLQEFLRAELAQAVAGDRAGIEIVAVLIEAIHPPAGAADAYHAVQAAEINADASVFNASGHAARTAGEAQAESLQALDSAQAGATEKVQAATADAYQFDADRRAYHTSPAAFLLERRARDLATALKGVRLTVVDSRLTRDQMPLVDLRSAVAAPQVSAAGPAAPPHGLTEGFAPTQPPATSTEQNAPPTTSEEAAEDAQHANSAPGAQQK